MVMIILMHYDIMSVSEESVLVRLTNGEKQLRCKIYSDAGDTYA